MFNPVPGPTPRDGQRDRNQEMIDWLREYTQQRYFIDSIRDISLRQTNERMEKYIDRILPSLVNGMVNDKISIEVPKFLDQNNAMKSILDKHQSSLSASLEKTCHDIMKKVAGDNKYHDMRGEYMRSIDERFQAQLRAQQETFKQEMNDNFSRTKKMEKLIYTQGIFCLGLAGGLVYALSKK